MSGSSNKYPFSYIDSLRQPRNFGLDDKMIVITFNPIDSDKVVASIKDSSLKASIEATKMVDTGKGKPEKVTITYVNKHTGFARITTTPGDRFNDTMNSLASSPFSETITSAMPAVKVAMEKGPDITKYFLPNRLAVRLKEELVKDYFYYEKYKEKEEDVDETERLVFKNNYVTQAGDIFNKYGLEIQKVCASPGLFSVSFPKQGGMSEVEQLVDALKNKYGLKTPQESVPQIKEAQYVDVHQVGFDAGLQGVNEPNDEYYANQWGVKNAAGNQHCQAAQAWNLTTGNGSRVHVAVLDTGCDKDHPDIRKLDANGNVIFNQIKDKFNAITNQTTYDSIDDNDNIDSHGTNVAGIIGAKTNNGPLDNGIAGVGWNCGLFIVKVADPTLATIDYLDVEAGINDVATKANNNNGAQGRRYVMNLSFKLDGNYGVVSTALANAWSKGVVIVAAAGDTPGGGVNLNTAGNEVWPACYPNVIIVAAHTNANGALLRSDSNFGNGPTYFVISAPGNNNHTTQRGGGVPQQKSGTSIAAAHVSGAAALCWYKQYQLNGNAFRTAATNPTNLQKRDQIRTKITTNLLGAGGTVAGRLDAYAAVNNMTA